MHIHKINDNKLEVFIGVQDLKENDITIQDFMSSSHYRHGFLFDVLEFASKEINFNYKNCEVILESVSIPAIQSFIVTITKIPYKVHKKINKKLKMNTFLLVRFKNFNTLTNFCTSLDMNIVSNLYYYEGFYYLNLKITQISKFRKILLYLKEFTADYMFNFFINENAKLIVKDTAIKFCRNLI